ncbi:MAG TPA: family 16 glycoside hydrolase [Pseudacidobacterium sp.]|nr:family 16 glycoside hydrolase [Pseudacidobacterium sp.]
MRARERWKKWPGIAALVIGILLCSKYSLFSEPLTPAEAEEGWLRLFDGTLTGWNANGNWQTKEEVLTSDMGDTRSIFTAYPLSDFFLKFDYRINATPSGAALRIRASHDGQPADSGYRIPLSDSAKDWPAGSIVRRSPAQAASIALNTWHSVTVEANGNHIKVEIDGRPTADIHDDSSRAGYIGFESTRGAALDLRNLRARPLNVKQIFDGSDLSGWKNVPYQHQAGKGLFHVFGGSGKTHSAEWSVKSGAIHGEKGPGAIETESQYDNFILQFKATADVDPNKKDVYPALSVRNQAGSIGTGYPLGISRHIGEIGSLAKPRKPVDNSKGDVLETVIVNGRSIFIFLNGALSTVYHDTRPEAASLKQGARVGSGVLSLEIPEDAHAVDIKSLAAVSIPSGIGGLVKDQPPPQAAAPKTQTAPVVPADTAAQAAQLAAVLGVPTPQVRSRSAELISRAVKSNDPQEQMDLYDQVIKMDPSNAAAIQGYKEAQQKLAAQQAQQEQQQQAQQAETQKESTNEQQLQNSLASAEASFLGGHIPEADRSLRIAERIAPSNPVVNDLRRRIDNALGLRRRLLFAGSAAGMAALLGGSVFFFRRRRLSRHPVLEVVQGLDQGRKYPLDRDVVRIGAIAQDGGQKNDIVVRDVEHMVSRFHCEVVKKNGYLMLKDMNSSNGTKVDGKAVPPGTLVPLGRSSRIDLGGTVVLRLGYERKKA